MNLSKETPETHLNPFMSIWTKPRQTILQIIEEPRSGFIFLLLVLSGYASILIGTLDTAANESIGIWPLIIGGLIISPLVAALGNAIGSLVSLLVGKIFKGTAAYDEMFRALLAGQIPQMWLIPLMLLWVFLLPSSFFVDSTEEYRGGDYTMNLILSIIISVISVWTLIVQSKAIGEAHGLSAWKGLLIILIPLLALFLIMALLVFSVM